VLRLRWLFVALVFFAFLACSGSESTSGIPPITGITIRAETLTTGRGCGRGPTQLFKYAAVVYGYTNGLPNDRTSYQTALTAGVYDCFADGTFVELPAVSGSFTYRLEVYAFTAPAYDAAALAIETAGTNAETLRGTKPTWTTVCIATQQRDVQSLAICDPLTATINETRIVLPTGAFSRADGRVSTCVRTATVDAGTDASDGGDGATDADAGDNDAGADAADAGDGGLPEGLGYVTVRATARVNDMVPAAPAEIPCPDTFTVHDAVPAAHYAIDVVLLDESGATVGTTTCTADTQDGKESSATCAPVE